MKFTLSWLKDFLDTTATPEEISERLTAIGLEVESMENKAAQLAGFSVAEILSAEKHPDADKLNICQVKTHSDTRQIVCGAPNARAGIKVVLADIGVTIPNGGFVIKKSKIRGVESHGMLCSARELNLGEDAAGIMELPASASIGAPIADVLGMNDVLFDVALTPNRGDCLGIYGIARDLAAAGLGTLRPLESLSITTSHEAGRRIQLKTADCPFFVGRTIRGVTNGSSPEWLQQRLKSIGLRPISTLVDITNFFTLAYGRPLHVYDAEKLSGDIQARASVAGESFAALNDKTYTLPAGLCVIADDNGVLGLGGVVGGVSSGCTETTTQVFLESAWFEPEAIATTGRSLQVESDARYRFERGVDPAFVMAGAEMATRMIVELCGGTPSDLVMAGTAPIYERHITFETTDVERVGGVNVPVSECERILRALGCAIEKSRVHQWRATTPSWRPDLSITEDLVEEILRIHGYDALPETPLPVAKHLNNGAFADWQQVRRQLAMRGLQECHHFAFVPPLQAEQFRQNATSQRVVILNPISADADTMRTSLLSGLIDAAKRNLDRAQNHLGLYEVGVVFEGVASHQQPMQAATLRLGTLTKKDWTAPARAVDVFDAKADLLSVLQTMGVETSNVQVLSEGMPAYYHPGKSATVQLGPKAALGWFGALHPRIARAWGIDAELFACEVRLDAIPARKIKERQAIQLSDYQLSRRDFAFVVDATLPAATLLQAVSMADRQLIKDVRLFDVYQGAGMAEGKKSLAITVTLQSDERTLSEADLVKTSEAIIEAAQKKGAVLR